MKILLYTDNHFCEKYSILQTYGTKYSKRLENQIKSINWVEQMAVEQNCDLIICLGDFFDKPELNEYEITAVKDISWSNLPHYYIVGNHESGVNELQFSSTKYLESDNHIIVDAPRLVDNMLLLPYVVESDRLPLDKTFDLTKFPTNLPKILLSHNDLKGIQMGVVESKTGYVLEDIENNFDLCINGHLHNGQQVSKKVINLGNLTGKDFGEDATKYQHNIMILDTVTLKYELFENPEAFNFYKLDILNKNAMRQLEGLKNNAVLTVKCIPELAEQVRAKITELRDKIVESRVIISMTNSTNNTTAALNIEDLRAGDHLEKLVECCKAIIGESDILDFELGEICK